MIVTKNYLDISNYYFLYLILKKFELHTQNSYFHIFGDLKMKSIFYNIIFEVQHPKVTKNFGKMWKNQIVQLYSREFYNGLKKV